MLSCLVFPAALAAQSPSPVPAPPVSPAWDVSNPPVAPGVWEEIAIDTDEGTWVDLDVSPDGRKIVFELLGDLYLLPIGGGEAKNISAGLHWDMHPVFSPDGSRIAFTSDRTGEGGKGGDNLWTIERLSDGSWGSPRQVSKETFRLVTQPAWTPDGRFIVGRKHFTSRRSIGAGEMWLYHAGSVSEGTPMTTKSSDQKDTGEPVFSPCGRYLYYSLDATPGESFEYDKDSNKSIFAIDRLDRVTGEVERLIEGPGGACRPTPSPDGASLAFVRRVRFQSTLFVMDLSSGEARAVYGGLERDMQEAWSIHGVSPRMAWTPDSGSIVAWAGGTIRRIDAATGEATVVPFRVKDTRRVARALRTRQEPWAESFDVRMITGAAVSPAGDRVVYSALGRMYVKALPGGEPVRLTTQGEDFEFMPSFSRDGSKVVYVSWNDRGLGRVRVIDAAGGVEGRAVTPEPGRYVDPVFTPDGERVVYGKVGGGMLSGPVWGRDPGLYVVSVGGGAPTLVSKTGTGPQFGAEGDRVFLTVRRFEKDSDKASLISVDLASGKDVRTHLTSDWATEFKVSPDGAWVAFAERFNVYVTPMVATGRAVAVGPSSGGVPVEKVSSSAGSGLAWSGDSSRLCWTLGPDLYTLEVSGVVERLRDRRGPGKVPEASATPIGFRAKGDAPTGVIALTGGRVVTMRDGDPSGGVIEDGVVVVEGNRIRAVGRRGEVAVPAGAAVIDAGGRTIVPGFIDVHAHGPMGEHGVIVRDNWVAQANLAFGVTTIHDPSNHTPTIFTYSEMQRAGAVVGPRTYSTGTILYGAAGSFRAEVESLEDALFHLGRMKAVGAFSVKSYNQPRRDQRQQVVEAARRLGMMVMPEGGSLFKHNMTMVIDGHSSVEHTLPVETAYRDVIGLWSRTDVGYTATLLVGYGGLGAENYWYDRDDVWAHGRLLRYVPRVVVDPLSRRRMKAPDEEYNHLRSARIPKALTDAGGRAHVGAHGQMPGLGFHWEAWSHAQGGMTPVEMLRAMTFNGARYIGMDHALGSLEAGKLADLVVLGKNPLEDWRNTDSVAMVMINGRLYDAGDLSEVAPAKGPARRYWFHGQDAGRVMFTALAGSGCEGCSRPGGACRPWLTHTHEGESGYR